MNDLLPFRRDLRVGGLLHAVVQEGVGLWIADCRLRIAGYGLCAADCGSYFQSAIRNPRSANVRISPSLIAPLRSYATSSGVCSLTMASVCSPKGFPMQDASVSMR